ncbi:ubiquitin-like small modifier protein SAMP2 [Haloarcula montana]|uniref:ubiquitin-like small modifier protein SAMP2 n=1 Tax=Haloarcula montana TaxID=3111776 RepID=UPI002D77C3C2|nr:ubiquitin-like small modifier protein 2 [Haloarcula sp. GH36]
MHVTVEVAGEETHEVAVGEDATYAEVVESLDLSPHAVSVMVEDRTVPTDQPVDSDHVTVVRLIKGG